jgi:hypothetical protein
MVTTFGQSLTGLAGLSTGVYAQMNGYLPDVPEFNSGTSGRTAIAPTRTLPGLANFYMAGQWVMPGGGVPPCLYSGRHGVQILCRRDGKPFVSNQPSQGLVGHREPKRA